MTARQVRLPYGRGALTVTEDGESPWEILLPGEPAEPMPEAALVAEAMAHPAGGVTLEELARDKATAVVILSDHTRPVPSRLLLPPMLAALRRGNPAIDITLLVATGCHRAPTAAELRDKLGEDLFRREKIVVHDCDDGANLVFRGTLPSGIPLLLNRLAAEAGLLAAEGFIEPHFFAGFSGGRKSVLPGICGRATVMGNHCAALIDDPRARAGCLEGNPVHRDMEAAAELAGLAYIVNVTLDRHKRITAAVAGSPRAAHRQGCALAAARAGLRPARPGDIVLTTNGGAPLDQNVYQTVKSLATAAEAAAEGGDLIVCAASFDCAVYVDQFPAVCDWEVIDIPKFSDDAVQYKAFGNPTNLLCVSKTALKHPEKVLKVLEFFYDDANAAEMYENGLYIPVRAEAVAMATKEPELKGWASFANFDEIFSMPPVPYTLITVEGTTYREAILNIWTNPELDDVEAIMADVDARYNAALAEVDQATLDLYALPEGVTAVASK